MENRDTRFPKYLVNVRVQANTSYQIKRVMEQVQKEKGLELMSCSEIRKETAAEKKETNQKGILIRGGSSCVK